MKMFQQTWKSSLKTPALLNPWKWAEKNIEFSTMVSPIPGKYSTVTTPYVRDVLEAVADPSVRHITLCWSAQSSKTTTAMIAILYAIDNDPGNVLMVRPSYEAAKSLSENKIMPMIEENECLRKHKTNNKDDFKKGMIKLQSMVIFVKGASPNQLSAESCKIVWLDETDKYELYDENKTEADLVSLAYERTKFYRNHLKIDDSTPTVPRGIIWQLFLEGDQRLYFVPCPYCGFEFNFKMDYFKFDKNNPRDTTYFECPMCKGKIEEKHKSKMMLNGRWKPQREAADPEHRSYQLPEFYSPITKWGELAFKFVQANDNAKLGNFGQLHNFINSSLAEPWDPTERASRKADEILALRDGRKQGIVPEGALAIIGTIDTQDIYLWYSITAWGTDLNGWEVLSGKASDFDEINKIMFDSVYKTPSGTEYKVIAGLIDSGGHRTAEVYNWCRLHPSFSPSKGERQMQGAWKLSRLEAYPDGRPIPGGLSLVRINTTYYKNFLAGKLALALDENGAFRITSDHDADSDLIKHLTAEYRNDHGVWLCPSGKRNDLWDCTVYALCLADKNRIQYWKNPDNGTAGSGIRIKKLEREQPKYSGWLNK